jgi:hypothetical protein
MKAVLHILTRPDDCLGNYMAQAQAKAEGLDVRIVDIASKEPDYDRLLEMVFEAESVQVW